MLPKTRATSLVAAVLTCLLIGSGARSGGETEMEPPRPAAEVAGCAESLTARVQTYYDRILGLRADFEQVSRSVALGAGQGATQSSKGNVVLAKPGKMRWEYTGPEPQSRRQRRNHVVDLRPRSLGSPGASHDGR